MFISEIVSPLLPAYVYFKSRFPRQEILVPLSSFFHLAKAKLYLLKSLILIVEYLSGAVVFQHLILLIY